MGELRESPGWQTHVVAAKQDLMKTKLGPAILADMKGGCPVDTTRLVDSLDFEVIGDDLLRIGSRDVDYSAYVEEGHEIVYRAQSGELVHTGQYVEAQPYMKPALYRKRGG